MASIVEALANRNIEENYPILLFSSKNNLPIKVYSSYNRMLEELGKYANDLKATKVIKTVNIANDNGYYSAWVK